MNTQHESPTTNQNRTLSNSSSVPQSLRLNENINLTETKATSTISSYDCKQQEFLPVQNLPNMQFNQCLNNQTMNSILKDRNNQETPVDKCTQSFKEQSGTRLLIISETQSIPLNREQLRIRGSEQLTPKQKQNESKRKSILFTVGIIIRIKTNRRKFSLNKIFQ